MITELQKLSAACNAAADFYCEKPNEAGIATVVDIYRTLAILASLLDDRDAPSVLSLERRH